MVYLYYKFFFWYWLVIIFSLTESCKVDFKDPNVLYEFTLTVIPGQKWILLVLQGVKKNWIPACPSGRGKGLVYSCCNLAGRWPTWSLPHHTTQVLLLCVKSCLPLLHNYLEIDGIVLPKQENWLVIKWYLSRWFWHKVLFFQYMYIQLFISLSNYFY